MNSVNGALELFAVLIMVMPLVITIGEKNKQRFQKYLIVSILCHMLVLLLDAAQWFLLDNAIMLNKEYLLLLTILPMIFALVSNACFILSLLCYVSYRIKLFKIGLIPMLLMFTLSIVTWVCFIISDGDNYISVLRNSQSSLEHSGLYWLSQLSWVVICFIGITIIIMYRKKLKRLELLSFLSYCAFPIFAMFSEMFWNGSQIYLSTTFSLVLVHSVLYREQKQSLREKEVHLTQSRIEVMINQIQPHFMFNTLSAICSLCDENPMEAKKVTSEFAEYLRHNVKSISQTTPVEFKTELRHVEVYLNIEKKRYENRLNIIYDINAQDFKLPALTVQPIVENAVKHGISKTMKTGTVHISANEHDSCYCIEISDDGVGFDADLLNLDTNKHIGIENVKNRLWAMCNGTLTIKSRPQVGTTVTIRLPKKRRD